MPHVELQIERLAHTGEGIGTLDGRAVFVEGALPFERVRVAVTQGKVLRGELLEVLAPNPSRRVPSCPLSSRCGGCDWLHFDVLAQREAKQQAVIAALEHLGGIAPGSYRLLEMVSGESAMGYRRRAVMHPAEGGLGFFGRRSHERVRVDRCPALTPALEALPKRLSEVLGAVAKDLEELRMLESDGRVALALVLKKAARPKVRQKAEELVALKVVQGVVLVEPNGNLEAFGEVELRDGETLLRPEVFAQANAEVNAPLVRAAVSLLAPGAGDRALELYSGNGNFTLPLSRFAKEVVAVESSRGAVALGQKAARAALRTNIRWIEGDSLSTAKGLSAGEQFECVLLDPPRTGAPGIAGVARKVGAQRLLYVACDAAALARDAKELAQHGYELKAVQVFDLFPQTRHTETISLWAR